MKTRLFSLFVALIATMSVFAYDFRYGDLYYDIISDSTVAVASAGRELTSAIIPEFVAYNGKTYSVTSIGSDAFSDCSGLTSITIPNSVTSIGEYAFSGCSGLTSITIPNRVTSIGVGAFYGCSGLTSITIPNSVTSIGDWAFGDCSGLTSITIPNGVTSIGGGAFNGCSGLTLITIPNSVTSIGKYAFYGCSGLILITIPNSVTSIGGSAFSDCSGLTSITIPNSVTSIGYGAFSYCIGLTSITVENGNTRYDSRNNCNAIIEAATNTLIAGCQNTTIPNSVTSIGEYAFYGCSGLTSITIPNGVTSIGDWAFGFCSGLQKITVLSTTPPAIIVETFVGVNRTIPVYVPAESVADYKGDTYWKEFNIQANATPIDYTQADETTSAARCKVIREGQVYILRGDKTYTATGIEVK